MAAKPAFLQEPPEEVLSSSGPKPHLGLFGKHPGWDDHMDGLGMTTPSLAAVKRMLYEEGIGHLADSGPPTASVAGEEEPLPQRFGHVFLWTGGKSFLLGRLWQSQDGKGRTAYPMVAVAHFLTAELPAELQMFAQVLERLQERCEQTTLPEEVAVAHSQAQQELLNLRQRATPARISGPGLDARRDFLANTMMGNEDGFIRLLFAMKTYLKPQSIAGDLKRAHPPAAVHFRVPQGRGPLRRGPEEVPPEERVPFSCYTFLPWAWFFQPHLAPNVPLLLCQPLGHPRMDVLIGLPEAADLGFLLSSVKTMPRTTDAPFKISDEDKAEFTAWCQAFEKDPFEAPGFWGRPAVSPLQGIMQRIKNQFVRSNIG